jgi:branched-chain amino acid transport system ATP-binding protein
VNPLGIKKTKSPYSIKPFLLDGTFRRIAFEESSQLMELIRQVRDRGIGVILIEHNMQVIMNLCRRIVVLDHGAKIAEGSPEEIRSNPQVVQAYLGKEA